MSNGLLDFGQGAFSGGGTGLSASAALVNAGMISNPWGLGLAAGSALLGGGLNFFAGREEEKERKEFNRLQKRLAQSQIDQGKQNLRLGKQNLQLGRLNISQENLKAREARRNARKMETFRRLFSESFA